MKNFAFIVMLAAVPAAAHAAIIDNVDAVKANENAIGSHNIAASLGAGTPLYSNVTTFLGSALNNGGAATGALGTFMVADDVTMAVGAAGTDVGFMRFSVTNLNASTRTILPSIRFYAADPTSNLPATLLGGLNFNAISVGATSVSVFSFSSATPIFTVPAGEKIYAGLFYTGGTGTTSTTAAQVNNWGQGLFDPPTVGSSDAAVFFDSTSPSTGSGSFAASSPAGALSTVNGAASNFGWYFQAIPEPSSMALLAPVGLLLGRRRRA